MRQNNAFMQKKAKIGWDFKMYEDMILKIRKLLKSEEYDDVDCLAIANVLQKSYLERVISSDDDVDFDEEDEDADLDEDESDIDEQQDEMEQLVGDSPEDELEEDAEDTEEPEEKEKYKVSIKRPNMGREK